MLAWKSCSIRSLWSLCEIDKHLDVDVRELLYKVASKKYVNYGYNSEQYKYKRHH